MNRLIRSHGITATRLAHRLLGLPHVDTSSGMRVFVVDDDEPMLALMARLLVSSGFLVQTSTSADDALRAATSGEAEIIVSDVAMPQFDGIELLRRLAISAPTVPCVLVTGRLTPDVASLAVAHQAASFVTKASVPSDLVAAVVAARGHRARAIAIAHAMTLAADQTARAAHRDERTTWLREALASGWSALQPIVDRRRRVFGHEALLRSDHASRPGPLELVGAAETLGLLPELGTATRAFAAAAWRLGRAHADTALFFNLHPDDLFGEGLEDEADPLAQVAPIVVLELIERVRLAEDASIRARVDHLRQRGFRIAIDDLGAGYASLSSVARLEPEFVKLDMGLVRGIDTDSVRRRIVRQLVVACHDIGATVVAEGVEVRGEFDALEELGVDLFQGYFIGRPMRATAPVAAPAVVAVAP